MKSNDYEQHVFHSGTSKEYKSFVDKNRDRVVSQELADDRVIVYCTPASGDNVIFVSGHFFGGI